MNGLRATPEHRTAWARIRRLVVLLVVDVALLAAIVIAVVAGRGTGCCGSPARSRHFAPAIARLLLVGATVALLIPFILGAIRIARALGVALAAEALPAPAGGARELDLAAAPRRALLVTLQIAILLVAGHPGRRGDAAVHARHPGHGDPARGRGAAGRFRSGAAPPTCRGTCAPARR